jgi:signal peptidase II
MLGFVPQSSNLKAKGLSMIITKRVALIFVVLVSCVACDQATKSVAQSFLSESELWSLLGDTVRLQLAYNQGAFLGFGATLPEAFQAGLLSIGVGGLLLVLLGFTLFSKSTSTLEILAFSLLLAGGAGNLIDRVICGYVVDFMNIGISSLRTGIFNVADIAVSVGVLILIADSLYERKESV